MGFLPLTIINMHEQITVNPQVRNEEMILIVVSQLMHELFKIQFVEITVRD